MVYRFNTAKLKSFQARTPCGMRRPGWEGLSGALLCTAIRLKQRTSHWNISIFSLFHTVISSSLLPSPPQSIHSSSEFLFCEVKGHARLSHGRCSRVLHMFHDVTVPLTPNHSFSLISCPLQRCNKSFQTEAKRKDGWLSVWLWHWFLIR